MQIIQSQSTHLHVFTIQYFHIRLLLRIFFYSVIEKKKKMTRLIPAKGYGPDASRSQSSLNCVTWHRRAHACRLDKPIG